MGYNAFPWAGGGRGEQAAVRPLPDDLEGLRHLYPAGGTRTEIAVLNTWFESSAPYDDAAILRGLCAPSLGDTWDTTYAARCGTGGPDGGSTTVCAGDRLYTRFTLANYSTEMADDLDVRAWFSTNDVFELSADQVSPTVRVETIGRARSTLQVKSWQVPANLDAGTEYYVIIEVVGTTASGAAVQDWIPMRGKVTAC
jgi:hypothetical protein